MPAVRHATHVRHAIRARWRIASRARQDPRACGSQFAYALRSSSAGRYGPSDGVVFDHANARRRLEKMLLEYVDEKEPGGELAQAKFWANYVTKTGPNWPNSTEFAETGRFLDLLPSNFC